jgi:cytochrome oxidase Cu insertion factor (SCO1/SenC/PrrC family)
MMRRHSLGLMKGVALAGLAAVLLMGGLAGAAPDFAAMQVQPYEPPKPAPPFSLPDLDGKTHQLTDLRGKAVMIFFWTTW